MKKRVNDLLKDIDPSNIHEPLEDLVNEALNKIRVKEAVIDDWDRFKMFLSECCHRFECKILNLSYQKTFDEGMCWTHCIHLLNAEYGPSGPRAAFEKSRTGVEGGLYSVLKSMARSMADEYAAKEIAARVGMFLAGLSGDEEFEACDSYLEAYGHLLPPELTEGSAARIKSNFARVLEGHPGMIRRIRKGIR